MLEAACAKYQVLFVGPLPLADDRHNRRISALSAALSQTVGTLGVGYVETFSALVSNARYRQEVQAYDGAHPRSYGYTELAKHIGASRHWWF